MRGTLMGWQVVAATALVAGCAHHAAPAAETRAATSAEATWSTPLSSGSLMMAGGQCSAMHGVLRIVRVEGPDGKVTVACQRPPA